MMVIIFILLLVTTVFIWRGYRNISIVCLLLTFALASIVFFTNVTSQLTIQL